MPSSSVPTTRKDNSERPQRHLVSGVGSAAASPPIDVRKSIDSASRASDSALATGHGPQTIQAIKGPPGWKACCGGGGGGGGAVWRFEQPAASVAAISATVHRGALENGGNQLDGLIGVWITLYGTDKEVQPDHGHGRPDVGHGERG